MKLRAGDAHTGNALTAPGLAGRSSRALSRLGSGEGVGDGVPLSGQPGDSAAGGRALADQALPSHVSAANGGDVVRADKAGDPDGGVPGVQAEPGRAPFAAVSSVTWTSSTRGWQLPSQLLPAGLSSLTAPETPPPSVISLKFPVPSLT